MVYRMLIQMAGRPGSGKTTLARALAARLGAAVLDLDVVKTPLLDEGVAFDDAGRIAYAVLFSLADDMLAAGTRVIIDSPARWKDITARGQRIAARRAVRYAMVECRLADRAELARRLAGRVRKRSQVTGAHQPSPESAETHASEAAWEAAMTRTYGPATGWLVLDTGRPVADCLPELLAYLR